MRNYSYILNCIGKHLCLIPNGIHTQIFANLDCPECQHKVFCNKVARVAQADARLNKEVSALGGKE